MTHTLNNPDPIIGRPSHQPTPETRQLVAQLARAGLRHCDIAAPLRISETTLRKWYKPELADGAAHARQNVMATLYQMATSGKNAAATIFFAKTRCGATENCDGASTGRLKAHSQSAKHVNKAIGDE